MSILRLIQVVNELKMTLVLNILMDCKQLFSLLLFFQFPCFLWLKIVASFVPLDVL